MSDGHSIMAVIMICHDQKTCCDCNAKVTDGHLYVSTSGNWEGQDRQYLQCMNCSTMMHAMHSFALEEGGELPGYGDLSVWYADRFNDEDSAAESLGVTDRCGRTGFPPLNPVFGRGFF